MLCFLAVKMQSALFALVIAAQILPIISSPIAQLDRRAVIHTVVDIVETLIVDVTVTVGPGAPATILHATTSPVAAPQQQNGRPQQQAPAAKVVTSVVVVPAPASSPIVALAEVKQVAPPVVTIQTTPAPAKTTAAAPSSTPSSSGDNCNGDTVCETALSAHNNFRKCHNITQDMTWSTDLANSATQLANSCSEAHNSVGQNIAMGTTLADAISMWYDEMSLFTGYDAPTPAGMGPGETAWETWAHYTQVVWKGSTQLGCATAQCPGAAYPSFTVCNYEAVGNMLGSFDQNVFANTCS